MLLNVSFGIYALLPQGWLFMMLVILCEAVLMSRFLAHSSKNTRIYLSALFSNAVSGLFGIITSLKLNGGWWLVVWFPWVSGHEVNIGNKAELACFLVYYFIAFFLSVLIELAVNCALLRKRYALSEIFKATLKVNIVTYCIGAVLLLFLLTRVA